jgi:hypothetical protein
MTKDQLRHHLNETHKQIIHDLVSARRQTAKFLDSLTATNLNRTGVYSCLGVGNVAAIIEVIGHHDDEHTQRITPLRQKMEVGPVQG